MQKIVIIGGGPAGRVIVHKLHQSPQADQFDITMVKDENINVNRCAIPYGINGKKEINKYQIPNTLVTNFGAKLVIDTVESIDPEKKIVHTTQGDLSYDKLIFATGASPFVPPLPGANSKRVHSMRTIDDLDWIREHAATAKSIAIVGAGFIGVEFAVELKKMGIKDVHLIELQNHILGGQYSESFTDQLEQELIKNGINLKLSHQVSQFQDTDQGLQITLNDVEKLNVDYAVMSIGVKPNTQLAADAGLEVSRLGIVVNKNLQTSNDNIYATGDCAQAYSYLSKKPIAGEFGTNAVFMSKVVADNLLGKNTQFPGVLNAAVSAVYDYSFGSTGLSASMAKQHGIEVVTGYSEVMDRYPMIDGVSKIKTELVFNKSTQQLIGGTVLRQGFCVASNIDMLSLAIQKKTTLQELMQLQYATHPELAAKPSDNTVVFAAQDVLKKVRGTF